MKVTFTDKKLLIVLIADLLISIGSPFLVHLICNLCGVTNFVYPLLFGVFVFVNFFLSYFVGDLMIIRYKNKNDIVTSDIPAGLLLRAKQWRYPFIISLLVCIAVFAIFAIIYSTTGHWPLM